MKPQEIARWKYNREKGMARFILFTGILSYGLPLFVVLNFLNPPKMPVSITDLRVTLLICAVAGGSAFGYILWHVQEKRYRKAREKQGFRYTFERNAMRPFISSWTCE